MSEFISHSERETEALGAHLAAGLPGGAVSGLQDLRPAHCLAELFRAHAQAGHVHGDPGHHGPFFVVEGLDVDAGRKDAAADAGDFFPGFLADIFPACPASGLRGENAGRCFVQ